MSTLGWIPGVPADAKARLRLQPDLCPLASSCQSESGTFGLLKTWHWLLSNMLWCLCLMSQAKFWLTLYWQGWITLPFVLRHLHVLQLKGSTGELDVTHKICYYCTQVLLRFYCDCASPECRAKGIRQMCLRPPRWARFLSVVHWRDSDRSFLAWQKGFIAKATKL